MTGGTKELHVSVGLPLGDRRGEHPIADLTSRLDVLQAWLAVRHGVRKKSEAKKFKMHRPLKFGGFGPLTVLLTGWTKCYGIDSA